MRNFYTKLKFGTMYLDIYMNADDKNLGIVNYKTIDKCILIVDAFFLFSCPSVSAALFI